MDFVYTILLGIISLAIGIGLVIYGFRGKRLSQAQNARTYKRGRL